MSQVAEDAGRTTARSDVPSPELRWDSQALGMVTRQRSVERRCGISAGQMGTPTSKRYTRSSTLGGWSARRLLVAWLWNGGDDCDNGGGGDGDAAGVVVGSCVTAIDSGDRVDRVNGSIFGLSRKSPPENVSSGGSMVAGGDGWPGVGREREYSMCVFIF
ncbi:hypothetical protein Tco_0783992 [Tanacetum coccineum]